MKKAQMSECSFSETESKNVTVYISVRVLNPLHFDSNLNWLCIMTISLCVNTNTGNGGCVSVGQTLFITANCRVWLLSFASTLALPQPSSLFTYK